MFVFFQKPNRVLYSSRFGFSAKPFYFGQRDARAPRNNNKNKTSVARRARAAPDIPTCAPLVPRHQLSLTCDDGLKFRTGHRDIVNPIFCFKKLMSQYNPREKLNKRFNVFSRKASSPCPIVFCRFAGTPLKL